VVGVDSGDIHGHIPAPLPDFGGRKREDAPIAFGGSGRVTGRTASTLPEAVSEGD